MSVKAHRIWISQETYHPHFLGNQISRVLRMKHRTFRIQHLGGTSLCNTSNTIRAWRSLCRLHIRELCTSICIMMVSGLVYQVQNHASSCCFSWPSSSCTLQRARDVLNVLELWATWHYSFERWRSGFLIRQLSKNVRMLEELQIVHGDISLAFHGTVSRRCIRQLDLCFLVSDQLSSSMKELRRGKVKQHGCHELLPSPHVVCSRSRFWRQGPLLYLAKEAEHQPEPFPAVAERNVQRWKCQRPK